MKHSHYPGYDPYLITAVIDGQGKILLENTYRDGSRISEQKLENGEVYRYDYIFVKNEIVQTIVDGPSGKRKFLFQDGIFVREE